MARRETITIPDGSAMIPIPEEMFLAYKRNYEDQLGRELNDMEARILMAGDLLGLISILEVL